MKNKLNLNFLSLFALLCLAFSNLLWSTEVDTVWVSDINGQVLFQHPVSKNILIAANGGITELNSQDGKFVRSFPFDVANSDLSPDGTKILNVIMGDTYIYEYPNMKLITKLEKSVMSKFINNDEVIALKQLNDYIVKYNIFSKEEHLFHQNSNEESAIAFLEPSKDGKFIAISTSHFNSIYDVWIKLFLVDTKSMTVLKQLEKLDGSDLIYEGLNFSYDSKFLAYYSLTIGDDIQRNIFSTETYNIVKNYNTLNLDGNYLGIKFLQNNLYYINVLNYDHKKFKEIHSIQLVDFDNDNILFKINNTNKCIYFSDIKYIYYTDIESNKTICLNISSLITGVTSPQPITIVKYQNKQLIINKENVRKIEVTDISGRVIINKIIENPFSNNTILPLNLANGAYLINITTDKESFTHKLMVME